MAASNTLPKQLFRDVSFFITTTCSEEVKQLLKHGGAKREFYVSDLVTHIITDSADFPQLSEVKEYNLPIVFENWVTMSARSDMLLPVFRAKPFSPDHEKLFTGIVVCPSQIPCDDVTVLWAMVTFYGGTCQLNLNPSCTHLVTPKPVGTKYEHARCSGQIKIVTPSWLTDSITQNKLLQEDEYTPAVEQRSTADLDPLLTPDGKIVAITTAPTTSTSSPVAVTECSDVSTSILREEPPSTLMSPDSPICMCTSTKPKEPVDKSDKQQLAKVKETPVKTQGEGTDVGRVDILMAERQAVALCKEEPFEVKPSEQDKSKQSEDACTRSCQQDQPPSCKSSVLAGCVFVVTDYQDCMDHSILNTWIEVIQLHGGCVSLFYSPRCTHLLCLNQHGKIFQKALGEGKKVVSAHWLNDVLISERMLPPLNPLHLPVPFCHKQPECRSMSISATGYTGEERHLVRNMIYVIGANYTGYMMRTNTHLICKSSDSIKYQKARDWGIPCVNAKWLGDIVSAGRVFPCALKRYSTFGEADDLSVTRDLVQQLMAPWKDELAMHHHEAISEKDNQKKRKQDDSEETLGNTDIKRQRLSTSPTVEINSNTPRVMFTGLPIPEASKLRKMLSDVGGVVADSHRNCTHLIATQIVRTVKFLSAISVCQYIVTPEWLEKSHESNHFLDPRLFPLKDVELETTYTMDLLQSLERAQTKPLLQGIQVYVTPNVEPDPASMKEIIECAGGQMLSTIPSQKTLSSLRTRRTEEGQPAFVVVTCSSDRPLCVDLVRSGLDLYSTELILAGALRQKLNFEASKLQPQ